jgi:putative FmdB family regulatory protein
LVPIYEFECEACGARFEELVAVGTPSVACGACGHVETRRIYSAQAGVPRLVRTQRDAGKQERRNAELNRGAKASFSERMSQARAAASRRAGSAGGDK